MREILFRGKQFTEDEWIYGYVTNVDGGFSTMIDLENTEDVVHSETIGQYTGLTDKNSRKIFEGDIVELHFSGARGVVIFDKGCYMIEVHAFGRTVRNIIGEYDKDVLEIIGNIHDNPELLKGE